MRNIKFNLKNNKENIVRYLKLHLCILFYAFSNVFLKQAAHYYFMSFHFLLFWGGAVLIMGFYAIFWQQVIKNFESSIAYSNKSITVIWVLLLSELFFHEGVAVNNAIGAIIIIFGIVMVTRDE